MDQRKSIKSLLEEQELEVKSAYWFVETAGEFLLGLILPTTMK